MKEIFKAGFDRAKYTSAYFRGGTFYFSQLVSSGSGAEARYDFFSFNIFSAPEYLYSGASEMKFVASNEKYFAVSEKVGGIYKISVVDSKTKESIGSVELDIGVMWAEIRDEKLVVIQSGVGGDFIDIPATIFSLPSLKVLKATKIVGAREVALWGEKIVALGRDVSIYDFDLNRLERIALPPTRKGANCGSGPLAVNKDIVFVVMNCGEISAYDLKSLALKYRLPSMSTFVSIVSIDDLLFVSPFDRLGERVVYIYSADSGSPISIEPIKGRELYVKDGRLVSQDYENSGPSPVWVYEIDKSKQDSRRGLITRVVSECKRASVYAEKGNLYRAIRLCESGGIRDAIQSNESSPLIQPFIKKYGVWLSQTFARYPESIPILEKMAADGDVRVAEGLAEARLKVRLFVDELGSKPPTDSEKGTEFGRLLLMKKPITRGVSIDFGAFDNLFYFSDEQVFVRVWSCSPGNGAVLNVYSRITFDMEKSISIAACDDEYQDAVKSVVASDSKVYLSVGYRWKKEGDGRVDFVSIDRASLEVDARMHLGVNNLFFDDGKLLSCACETYYSACTSIDTVNFSRHDEQVGCLQEGFGSEKNLQAPPVGERLGYIKASGLGEIQNSSLSTGFPKIGQASGEHDSVEVSIIATPSSLARVIIDFKAVPQTSVATLVDGNLAFIGRGHDLLVYELDNFRLRRYIKDFIPAPVRDNGFGVDKNAISRLLVDRGRLLALTRDGKNSQLMQLSEIY